MTLLHRHRGGLVGVPPIVLPVVLVAVVSALLYGHRLEYAPPHIEIDEVLIALDAHATATTGHDLAGRFLPLYFQTAEHSWYQPFVIYLTALALKVLPFSEWTVRLPTVCIGIANIVLIYFVARCLTASDLLGAVAAGLLALTPAHFIHSRYGMDYIYPLPFILGWLLCLLLYNDRRREHPAWLLVLATGLLGIGFYSYIASIAMMPLYFLLTCLMLVRQKAPRRVYGLTAAGFFPALVPFLVWVARHPTAYSATVAKYGLYDPSELNAVQGVRSFISYASIGQRLSEYWNFFNPSFLFFRGATKLMFSTNQVGVFLLPFAVFLVIGIWRAVKYRSTPIPLIVLLGFLTAPMAALIVAEEEAIFRALALLPFGVLLATIGVEHLWSGSISTPLGRVYRLVGTGAFALGTAYLGWTLVSQSRITRSSIPLIAVGVALIWIGSIPDGVKQWRIITILLLVLMPLQFRSFWSDYFSDYRVRSSFWLGGNIGGALEAMIDRDRHEHVPRMYFSTLKSSGGRIDGRNQYMDAYWRFYLIKNHREDLLARTLPFEPERVEPIPRGSLVLANDGDPTTDALVRKGELRRVMTVPELNRSGGFVILQR